MRQTTVIELYGSAAAKEKPRAFAGPGFGEGGLTVLVPHEPPSRPGFSLPVRSPAIKQPATTGRCHVIAFAVLLDGSMRSMPATLSSRLGCQGVFRPARVLAHVGQIVKRAMPPLGSTLRHPAAFALANIRPGTRLCSAASDSRHRSHVG